MEKKKNKRNDTDLAAQAGAASETVHRYGSAVKEHIVSYSGVDNETGKTQKKSLKGISKSNINEEYRSQNLRQQAGYSAEVKYSARKNAKNIIDGSKERYYRTDDLGRVNDPLFDHVQIDKNGVEIVGSGEQMKFVGSSPKECLQKIKSKGYEKYINANAKITVPSDYYKNIEIEIDKEIATLSRQLKNAEERGRGDLVAIKIAKIEKLQKIKKNLNNSGITNAEALEARLTPGQSVAKDIVRVSHRAGVEQAKLGVLVSGGISLIRNVVYVCRGEKTANEAARDLACDSAVGAITGYATAFAGSTIKGTMQNASNNVVRSLSKSNIPATIVTATMDVGKSLTRYIKGEITGLDFLTEIGEKGISNMSAALFAGIGQVAIPIPVVGAMVGSMLGYALSSHFFKELVFSLKDEKLSYESRRNTEMACEEAIGMIQEYRKEMRIKLVEYFTDLSGVFKHSFSLMDDALISGDVELFIQGANNITLNLGGETQFTTMDEFEEMMRDNRPFKL